MPRDVDGYTVKCKVTERDAAWLGAAPMIYSVHVKQGGKWAYVGSIWRENGWAGCVEKVQDGPFADRLWSLTGHACEDTMRDLLWWLIPAAEKHGLITKGGE